MKKISTYNVEAWLLDYHEGRLSKSEIDALHAFLEKHDEFSIDPDFDPTLKAPVEEISFSQKSDLYRTDFTVSDLTEEEIECVAYVEGDLYPAEQDRFEKSLADFPDKALLLADIQKTKLESDLDITYASKEELHRKIVVFPRYIYGALAAAAVVILAWFVFSPNQIDSDPVKLAEDSARSVIYLDKLVHPAEYDMIAGNAPERSISDPIKSDLIEVDFISDPIANSRTDVALTKLTRLPAQNLSLGSSYDINSSNAFRYSSLTLGEPEDYKTLLAYSGEVIRKNILGQDPELVKKSRFSIWELADAGLEKAANLLSLPVDIDREYNQDGDLVEVSFDSRLLAFTTPINNKRVQ